MNNAVFLHNAHKNWYQIKEPHGGLKKYFLKIKLIAVFKWKTTTKQLQLLYIRALETQIYYIVCYLYVSIYNSYRIG